jgi:hypothetical protein
LRGVRVGVIEVVEVGGWDAKWGVEGVKVATVEAVGGSIISVLGDDGTGRRRQAFESGNPQLSDPQPFLQKIALVAEALDRFRFPPPDASNVGVGALVAIKDDKVLGAEVDAAGAKKGGCSATLATCDVSWRKGSISRRVVVRGAGDMRFGGFGGICLPAPRGRRGWLSSGCGVAMAGTAGQNLDPSANAYGGTAWRSASGGSRMSGEIRVGGRGATSRVSSRDWGGPPSRGPVPVRGCEFVWKASGARAPICKHRRWVCSPWSIRAWGRPPGI